MLGYDGKGQTVVHTQKEASKAWQDLNQVECILEQKIDLAKEISVVVARSSAGEVKFFPVAENVHRDGILFSSTVPANVDEAMQQLASSHTQKIAEDLNYCGVLAVEYFVDHGGNLYFNEMAPRTHNSGHYTIDACHTSQFEQQVRAICGLPLGESSAHNAVTMVNLLGDLWQPGQPDWSKILSDDNVKLPFVRENAGTSRKKDGSFQCFKAKGSEYFKQSRRIIFNLINI